MNKSIPFYLIFVCLFMLDSDLYNAQNETKKWYFGINAAIDFTPSVPVALLNSGMLAAEGCASIANGAGNLLFYTNGVNIWNQNHAVMANGTGLFGNSSTTQSAIIVKQPGQNFIYYVFTLDADAGPNGLQYSIVDMSLAAGMGSVTTKNNFLYAPSTEKLCAVAHCNNNDVWILSHEWGNSIFRAYLLNNIGLASNPITSTVGSVHSGVNASSRGHMKASPSGRKLGLVTSNTQSFVEILDFDNASGLVSNPLTHLDTLPFYGCEFSPNSSKFYVGGGGTLMHYLYQFDLCAGSNAGLLASKTLIPTNPDIFALQLAPTGKIYIGSSFKNNLAAINEPNLHYPFCNYQDSAISIAPKGPAPGLPNFVASYFRKPAAFGYTSNCQFVNFEPIKGALTPGCTSSGNPITSVKWNFGDAGSANNNISFALNPNHTFSAPGTYVTQLVINYACYSDTINQTILIPTLAPNYTVSGTTAICKGETRTLTVNNPNYTYNWGSSGSGTMVTISPTISTTYTVTANDTVNGCNTKKVFQVTVSKCTGLGELRTVDLVNFFPNPVRDVLQIASPMSLTSLIIYNHLGEVVRKIELNGQKDYALSTSDLSEGIYFLQCELNGEMRIEKFVKMQ